MASVDIRKKVNSANGEFELETPRDRAGTFEPKLVKKHRNRAVMGVHYAPDTFHFENSKAIMTARDWENLPDLIDRLKINGREVRTKGVF